MVMWNNGVTIKHAKTKYIKTLNVDDFLSWNLLVNDNPNTKIDAEIIPVK